MILNLSEGYIEGAVTDQWRATAGFPAQLSGFFQWLQKLVWQHTTEVSISTPEYTAVHWTARAIVIGLVLHQFLVLPNHNSRGRN